VHAILGDVFILVYICPDIYSASIRNENQKQNNNVSGE
jgi:hypothetical protein